MNRLNTTKSGKYLMAIIKIYHGDTWRLLWLYCSSSFPVAVIKTLLLRTTQERKGLLSAYWLQSTMEEHEGRNSTRNLKQKPLLAGSSCLVKCLIKPRTASAQGIALPTVGPAFLHELSITTIHRRPIWSGQSLNCPFIGDFRLCQADS